MLLRLKQFIDSARHNAAEWGWSWLFRERFLRLMGAREGRLTSPNLSHPVWCRLLSSDVHEFAHLLGRRATIFNLPITPRYIVDAGSNVGYSVLRFRSDYPGASIVAIEPEARNLVQLKKNLSAYPDIPIEHAALWSHPTKLAFTSLDTHHNAFQVEEGNDGEIEALTVRNIMDRHCFPRIDLLKIDIEGSEKNVFESPSVMEWLPHVRMILIETHDRFKDGCTEAVDLATKSDFVFERFIGEYRLYLSVRHGHDSDI